MRPAKSHQPARRSAATLALAAFVLFASTFGCAYNNHTNMGMTEKWVHSEVDIVTKSLGLLIVPVVDALISPLTMAGDLIFRDVQYHPAHQYLSYAGTRTVGRADFPYVYHWWTTIVAFVFETVYLPITGLIDLVAVLAFGDDGTSPEDADWRQYSQPDHGPAAVR